VLFIFVFFFFIIFTSMLVTFKDSRKVLIIRSIDRINEVSH
jgi:hypothetical protein